METNNYTLTKLIRTGISPICAMIGTSAYYGQVRQCLVICVTYKNNYV
ncbi:hypothetical protein [Spiroplasma endosymbiont of Amphimallon solstitiale]